MRQTITGLVALAASCCLTVHADQCDDFEIAVALHQVANEHVQKFLDQGVQVSQDVYLAAVAAGKNLKVMADAAGKSFSGQANTTIASLRSIHDATEDILTPVLEMGPRNTLLDQSITKLYLASEDAYYESIKAACNQKR